MGRVRESLIKSEKTSTSPVFGGNIERLSCIWFSIIHPHDQIMEHGLIVESLFTYQYIILINTNIMDTRNLACINYS